MPTGAHSPDKGEDVFFDQANLGTVVARHFWTPFGALRNSLVMFSLTDYIRHDFEATPLSATQPTPSSPPSYWNRHPCFGNTPTCEPSALVRLDVIAVFNTYHHYRQGQIFVLRVMVSFSSAGGQHQHIKQWEQTGKVLEIMHLTISTTCNHIPCEDTMKLHRVVSRLADAAAALQRPPRRNAYVSGTLFYTVSLVAPAKGMKLGIRQTFVVRARKCSHYASLPY